MLKSLSIIRMALAALAIVTGFGVAVGQQAGGDAPQPIALIAEITGPIGPATTHHVERVIEAARDRDAAVLILQINTPGGLADAMREIISEILISPVPVVGYVSPPGAHAASAGTYILYATHVAAMAPGTNLGAATPVSIGAPSPPGGQPADRDPPERGDGGDTAGDDEPAAEDNPLAERIPWLAPDEAMTAKATNDAVALIRSLAEMHGRNADWAESAVREAASLSSAQALEENVIDLVAADVDELLEAIDGRKVTVNKAELVLRTRGLTLERIEMDPITRLLGVLSNPNIALILMMIGVYGLIFEFWNPGAVAPGVVGAICLTLGLYSLNQLPLDYAGLALVGLGIAFMVTEAMTPTLGILGFGGLIAFVLGAAMLIDTDVPAYQVSWWLIGFLAALSGAFLTLLLGYTVRVYRRRPMSGSARVVGAEARVLDWSGTGGHVWVEGERWRATGTADLAPGMSVRIDDVEGLTLVVRNGAKQASQNSEGPDGEQRQGEP